MKINEVKKDHAEILEESLSSVDNEQLEIEEAYNELELLREVMETANFGLLIGRHDSVYEEDLQLIHGAINRILRNNRILQEAGMGWEADGKSVLSQLSQRVKLGLNKWFSLSLSGLLGWVAVTGFVATPIGAILSGAAGVSAAIFALAGLTSSKAKKSFEKASEVVAISELVAQSKPINSAEKRTVFQKMRDRLSFKTPQEVKKDSIKRAERNADKAGRKLDKALSNMPETIRYLTQDGKVKTYEVWKLFDSNFIPPEKG